MSCLRAAFVLAICVPAALAAGAPPEPRPTPSSKSPDADAAQREPEAPKLDSGLLSSPSKKFFLPALLEVTAFNVVPNLWNCWVRGKECVTPESWRANLERGFAYDPDKFTTNQLSHPQQGGLYYAAARSNGWNFYESALFTFYGSLTWEYFGETTRPSTNDLITTTLGGISAGETSYRLSDLVFDNTQTGFKRFLRELAGLAVSPGRVLHRLTTGEAWRVAPNAAEKPEWLDFELAGGWIHVESNRDSDRTAVHDRATLPMALDYGDPFERDLGRPFSTFHLEAEFTNGKQFVSRVQTEGLLTGRRLESTGPDRTVAFVSFLFDYLDVDLAFSQQALGFGAASRLPLGGKWNVLARAELLGSFGAVHTTEDSVATTYRNYDYGAGGGVRASVRVRRAGRDALRLAVDDVVLRTANGPTRWNQVIIARGSASWPLSRALALSAEYTWHRHRNVFPQDTQLRTSRQVRVLVAWAAFGGKP